MDYETSISSGISVYHYSASVSEIENAIGRVATKSVNRGDLRRSAESPPYDRSAAFFEVSKEDVISPEKAVSKCLELLERSSNKDTLDAGSVSVILRLFDPGFIQLNLGKATLKRLADAGASLVIENRNPP